MRTGSRRPIRVMQSFGPPRPTSNPYVHMLDAALAATPGVEHLRFDRRRALLGRYDAIQFHWPDTLFGGSSPVRVAARRIFAEALRIRLALSRIAVLRTVHNLEPHASSTPWERRYLAWLERRTDHRILLHELTGIPADVPSTLIRHGHYRDWFAAMPAAEPSRNLLGFVGLVRPYKGVEELLDAFGTTASRHPELRLRIAGNPSSEQVAREVRRRAALDARVSLDLRYLSEEEFVDAVTQVSGLVLPYRFMLNSGTVLAALSLQRPVLVPRTEINEALAREVGPDWITMFDGALTGEHVAHFAASLDAPRTAAPDLSLRDWDRAGPLHRTAFSQAVAHRDARRRP
ncbi:glycosyltransferase [Agrococcus sp. ProA11]|uniref:glycosyltransferase n=1 Tax=Agrococcus chionoecetis TaxID=3153752 RepID=UPI003260041A